MRGTLAISQNNVEIFVIENVTDEEATSLAEKLIDSAKFSCYAEFFVSDIWEWNMTRGTKMYRRK